MNGGSATGGSATGGSATGGSATGGSSTGGQGHPGSSTGGTGGSGLAFPIKIMPLGDSITAFTCWRADLWNTLNQAHPSKFNFVGTMQSDNGCSPSGYDADEDGWGSALITEIVAGVTSNRTCAPSPCPTLNTLGQAFSTTKPDVILMHYGTNDLWNGISPTDILSAYSAVVDRARSVNPKIHFIVAQLIPLNPSGCGGCAARVPPLNAAIPGWASGKATEASTITVVDQWTGFNSASDTDDGVHPNLAGSVKMAAKWDAALEALF
jgi:lysophospholipase L1-like esterase